MLYGIELMHLELTLLLSPLFWFAACLKLACDFLNEEAGRGLEGAGVQVLVGLC